MFPVFIFYSFLFGDPISGAVAATIHKMWDEDEPRPKIKPFEVPNTIETPGDWGDYDA